MRWQQILKENVIDLQSLLDLLEIPMKDRLLLSSEDYGFPLMVPKHFIALMEKGNIQDPLLRQVLPHPEEKKSSLGFSADPLQEKKASLVAGCLHKYSGRVLIITAGRCAINCRYCFRRHFPYENHSLTSENWAHILQYIRNDLTIKEVIFSGGEPFIVSDAKLAEKIRMLEELPQVEIIRFHTRLLVTLPARMSPSFFEWMGQPARVKKVIVLHVNHPNELHPILLPLFHRLKMMGVTLLNQSVLLKGVNDQVDVLEALSRKLFDYGVLPYYLHQLDPITGTQHFLVPLSDGRELYRALKARCQGYLVPKYVVELADLPYKETLDESTPQEKEK
jgi:L-lysine 2,3-aminomutase